MARKEFNKLVQRSAFVRADGKCEGCGAKLDVGKFAHLCPAFLRECLAYDAPSGTFVWKVRPLTHFANVKTAQGINTRQAGEPAGSVNTQGYVTIRLNRKLLLAHRVAWVMWHGQDIPAGMMIDHINGDRADNRIINLRLADATLNSQNCRVKKGKTTPRNVFWDEERQRFAVYVAHQKKMYFGGRFTDATAADAAAKALRTLLHGVGHAA